jgi:hypothetical protein
MGRDVSSSWFRVILDCLHVIFMNLQWLQSLEEQFISTNKKGNEYNYESMSTEYILQLSETDYPQPFSKRKKCFPTTTSVVMWQPVISIRHSPATHIKRLVVLDAQSSRTKIPTKLLQMYCHKTRNPVVHHAKTHSVWAIPKPFLYRYQNEKLCPLVILLGMAGQKIN